MDRKGQYRAKKRKFSGNRHTNTNILNTNTEVKPISTSSKKLKLSPRPRSDGSNTTRPKTSHSTSHNEYNTDPKGYRFVDLELLGLAIKDFLSCKVCGSSIRLAETNVRGLGSTLVFECSSCKPAAIGKFQTSKNVEKANQAYEINTRAVYAMRSIGQGLTAMKKVCAVMNMLPPVAANTYNTINRRLVDATKAASAESMMEAIKEEINETKSDPNTDITVSGDGTWMKRGHTSLMGVCSLIGANTRKVVDLEVLSSFCHGCSTWKGRKGQVEYQDFIKTHRESGKCMKNHFGSAGSMEVAGVKKMFHRSQDLYGVRYTNYIGDGDTSTYPALCESKPYGPDVSIIKEECIGHIQKRMSTRLRNLKKKNKGLKLSDGKPLFGRNRLTDGVIDKLAVYYGNAIRDNTNDLTKMRMAVWALWNHKASSDEDPRHQFCPKGLDSWCQYQKAVTNNTVDTFKHKNTIPMPIMAFIKPVFLDLSKPELLRRCLKGLTQNANESYNSVLWSICPKRGFAGRTVVEIAAYEAALIYNDGCLAKTKVLNKLRITPGEYCEAGLRKLDERRVCDAEKRAKNETLEARRARRRLRIEDQDKFEEVEGVTYASGAF